MRLVDADAFLAREIKRCHCVPLVGSGDRDYESLKLLLQQEPTIDAVRVVRCKDCKHSYVIIDARCCSRGAFYDVAVPDDFFCALAERKDGDSECLKSVQYGQSCRSRAKSVNATAANGTASAIKNAPAAVEIGI